MANAQYTIGNADVTGTAFTVPGDQPGTDASFRVQPNNLDKSHDCYVHIENGFNENVDVTLQGSHYLDENMDHAGADGAAITVQNGEVDFFTVTSNHTYIEVSVLPAADPTSGDLTVTFQSREA